jgi:16S rRNA A1518/A1519 N6-dimethyltransferase RsmA/KsgA/DIM1 with predicted DNA glycosylase/AP lyase activity
VSVRLRKIVCWCPASLNCSGPAVLLELGSGAGQLTVLLRDRGFDVVASDYAPFFVEHLASLGLDARRVDATDIDSGEAPSVLTI